jgi:SPP1 family predicted phage head-tail adaptor
MRTRIELQSNDATDTRLAEKRANWQTFARCWAEFEPLESREYTAGTEQRVSDVTQLVKLRWHRAVAGVTAAHRVKVGERILDIDGVINPGQRNRELHLTCREGKS